MFSLIELDGIIWKIDDESGRTWLYDADDQNAGWVEITDKLTSEEKSDA